MGVPAHGRIGVCNALSAEAFASKTATDRVAKAQGAFLNSLRRSPRNPFPEPLRTEGALKQLHYWMLLSRAFSA
jgi:hypothetical protein